MRDTKLPPRLQITWSGLYRMQLQSSRPHRNSLCDCCNASAAPGNPVQCARVEAAGLPSYNQPPACSNASIACKIVQTDATQLVQRGYIIHCEAVHSTLLELPSICRFTACSLRCDASLRRTHVPNSSSLLIVPVPKTLGSTPSPRRNQICGRVGINQCHCQCLVKGIASESTSPIRFAPNLPDQLCAAHAGQVSTPTSARRGEARGDDHADGPRGLEFRLI